MIAVPVCAIDQSPEASAVSVTDIESLNYLQTQAKQKQDPILKKQYIDQALPVAELYSEWPEMWIALADFAYDLNDSKTGVRAGQQLLKIHRKNPADLKLQLTLAKLGQKGWIYYQPSPVRSSRSNGSPFTMSGRNDDWPEQIRKYKNRYRQP